MYPIIKYYGLKYLFIIFKILSSTAVVPNNPSSEC